MEAREMILGGMNGLGGGEDEFSSKQIHLLNLLLCDTGDALCKSHLLTFRKVKKKQKQKKVIEKILK